MAVTLVGGAANAAVINVTTSAASPQAGLGIATSSTTGADMDGMRVTATFLDGSTDLGIWGTPGATSGAAVGGGGLFNLSVPNNTFFAKWTLTNTYSSLLTSLVINAGSVAVVFDIIASPATTPGSSGGRAFTDATAGLLGTINVQYVKPVNILPNSALGDLYSMIRVDFTGLNAGGISTNTQYKFTAETDNLDLAILIGTPVPAALPLMLASFAGLAWMGHRRKALAD